MSLDVAAVHARLPGRRVDWHQVLPTTMLAAAELARAGALSGTVVGADEQTAGIGRLGRHWTSPAQNGLYFSLILRPSMKAADIPILMLALGLAAKESIEALTGLVVDLRWPNDVLIDGFKCAGILAQWEGDAMIAGIGINVAQTEFPEGLDTPATSLLLRGARVKREDLLVELLQSIDQSIDVLARHPQEILRRFAP